MSFFGLASNVFPIRFANIVVDLNWDAPAIRSVAAIPLAVGVEKRDDAGMKHLLYCFTTALLFTVARPVWAAADSYEAIVIGTVQTQIYLGPGDGRIHTALMNNKRIFQEFGVSSQDYALVVKLVGAGLYLEPKSASAMLPEIEIYNTGTTEGLTDNKAHLEKYSSAIVAGGATNIFQNMAGEIVTAYYYKGDRALGNITKIVANVTARGTDPVGGFTTSALLKFKVVAQKPFAQKP
jgi:hypothetical protein